MEILGRGTRLSRRDHIVALLLVVAALGFLLVRAESAFAHGDCYAKPGKPYRIGGTVYGTGVFECTNNHWTLYVEADLKYYKDGNWWSTAPVVYSKSCITDSDCDGDDYIWVRDKASCQRTKWKLYAYGEAYNKDGDLVHADFGWSKVVSFSSCS